ncbi:MAG: hypothetical protein ABI648_11830 [Betaproteobacteria bacterium]|jgi:hypothetical protein
MVPQPTFIVRLFRQARHEITGVVEDVRSGRRTPFANSEELWRALSVRPPRARRKINLSDSE